MMKKITILCVLMISTCVFAQQKVHVDIDWKDVEINTSNESFTIPGFEKDHFEFKDDLGVRYAIQWDESREINEATARIENVVYKTITKGDLKDLSTGLIPQELQFNIRSTHARNKKAGFASISPIIEKGNVYKKVTSFDVIYETSTKTNKNAINAKKLPLSNSVLASGEWFRFYVDKTGVFRITPDFLSSLGMDLSSVNPSTIKIYGNGGQMMPLINQENTEFDLRENAIQLVGGEDGSFSGDDHILLYGEGVSEFSEENLTNINLYDEKSYYYVTAGGANGRRVSNYIEPSGEATTQINSFTDYQFYEIDEYNIARIGRRWFGDRFDIENNKNYTFNFPNLITSEAVELRVVAAAVSASSSSMNIVVNGEQTGVLNFSQVSGSSVLGSDRSITRDVTSSSDQFVVNLNYNNNGNPAAIGYLDFISLEAKRELIGTNSQMPFFYDEAATAIGIGQYNISNAETISQVWDVTNPETISSIANTSSALSFKAALGELRKYIAVVATDYFDPLIGETTRVDNQDIKGTIFLNAQGQFEDVDYLIITNNTLLQAANRLADHHRTLNDYNVKVVPLDQIYHEFSSGKQDIVAIRNLVRYVYDNASNESERVKFACFLGDGSIDYKNLLAKENCTDSNIVPTFQSLNSFSLVSSFATDDFFGSMDPAEGSMATSDQLDLAVGRILADTPQLADAMVSKIINYDSEQSFGRWRNSVLLVADDVDVDWEETIQRNLDELGESLIERKPFINLTKIYADAFQQESSASGNRYPKVNEALISAMEAGAIAVDYFGHGGEDGLAKEFIFNKSDGVDLQNENRYPVFITVTCEYTKFDNPCRDTAGELNYWNNNGGTVALISTTRNVTVTDGILLNDRMSGFLFPDGSEYPSIAEAVRQTKNSLVTNSKRRVVFFFGDPAMKMAIPRPNVRLTAINDIPISQSVDTLKALSRIKLSGEIINESGTLISDYNGVLSTTIYDKEIDRVTLANDNTRNREGEIIRLNYKALGEIIFRGKASVTNGVFDFEFIVPRDIGIPVDTGKVSFYSSRNGVLENQTGVDQTVLIGGLNENAPEDDIGPQIQLFMNDESFISGGVTNDSPILIAKLQDDNGINTASGIGHDISVILDGDETNPFILNDFYETELDDFTKGVVNFKFKDLEPGLHTLTFKGWDVYNNSSTQEIQFLVTEATGFTLNNVLNYPNPFVSYTEFWFEHSGSVNDFLDVQIQVFTVSGKVIWTQNQTLSGKTSYREDIQWNGRDDFGDKLGKGVYVYKISVKSTLTNERVEKFEKLVIL